MAQKSLNLLFFNSFIVILFLSLAIESHQRVAFDQKIEEKENNGGRLDLNSSPSINKFKVSVIKVHLSPICVIRVLFVGGCTTNKFTFSDTNWHILFCATIFGF